MNTQDPTVPPVADETPRGCIELGNHWYTTSLTFEQVGDIEKRTAEVLWPLAVIIPALLALFGSAGALAVSYLWGVNVPRWSVMASWVSMGVVTLFGILWGALAHQAKKTAQQFLAKNSKSVTPQESITAFGDYDEWDRDQFVRLSDAAKNLHWTKLRLESARHWSGVSSQAGNQELVRLTQAVTALINHGPANQKGRKASVIKRELLTPEMRKLADDFTSWKAERDLLETELAAHYQELIEALKVIRLAADMAA